MMSETYKLYVDGVKHSENVDDLMVAKSRELIIYYADGDIAGIRKWDNFYMILADDEENDD